MVGRREVVGGMVRCRAMRPIGMVLSVVAGAVLLFIAALSMAAGGTQAFLSGLLIGGAGFAFLLVALRLSRRLQSDADVEDPGS